MTFIMLVGVLHFVFAFFLAEADFHFVFLQNRKKLTSCNGIPIVVAIKWNA